MRCIETSMTYYQPTARNVLQGRNLNNQYSAKRLSDFQALPSVQSVRHCQRRKVRGHSRDRLILRIVKIWGEWGWL